MSFVTIQYVGMVDREDVPLYLVPCDPYRSIEGLAHALLFAIEFDRKQNGYPITQVLRDRILQEAYTEINTHLCDNFDRMFADRFYAFSFSECS